MKDCAICTESIEKEMVCVCGHSFHTECIMKWCLVKNTCPLCRSQIIFGPENDESERVDLFELELEIIDAWRAAIFDMRRGRVSRNIRFICLMNAISFVISNLD